MSHQEREHRLLQTFAMLLPDHRKDFEGFVRDIENVRYCHTPVDSQQLGRCEYAMRNMDMSLLTVERCIESHSVEGEAREALIEARNEWRHLKATAERHLREVSEVVEHTRQVLHPLRQAVSRGVDILA